MKKILPVLQLLFVFLLFCDVPISPIDPDNPDYEPPSFIVDKNISEVSDGDSVGTSSVEIVVKGNMNANQFRWRLDEGEWSEWEKQENDKQYTIALSGLEEPGEYIVGIETRYNDQEDVQSGTVSLYRLPQRFTVSYDGNGETDGEVPVDDQTYTADAKVLIQGNTGSLENEDNVFVGWNTRDDGCGTGYLVGDTMLMDSRDMVLYAQWSDNGTFTVTYKGNGQTDGTVPSDPNNYESNAMVMVRRNDGGLEKDDATFIGWNTEEDGTGNGFKPGEQFIIRDSDVTLYAQWTSDETFGINYDDNGSTSGSVPVDENRYEQSMVVTVLANTGALEKDEASFIGWNTEVDGSGESYVGGASFEIGDADVTLYAQWSEDEIFTVTYDANGATGGSVPVDLNNYLEDATVTISGNSGSLVNEGNVFIGWNSKDDGSGTLYRPGSTFVISDKNVTLYALWNEFEVFSIMYDGNENDDGTVPVDAKQYEEGDEVVVLGNNGDLSRTGFSFSGWNTVADGSGTAYAGGALFEIGDEDITLYAQWNSNSAFMVTYDGNGNTGGSVPVDGHSYDKGASVTVSENTGDLVKGGATFAGWNTAEDGSGTSFTGGETFNMGEENVTLYASWTTNPTFTVSYEGNGNTGGEVPTDGNNYEEGAIVAIRGNTGDLVFEGKTFIGWNSAEDGDGDAFSGGATFEMGDEDVTLYAQWTVNPTFTVSYDGNGNTDGDVPVDANNYENGVMVTVCGNTGDLLYEGKTFTGWNTAEDGDGEAYAGGETFEMEDANVILYAQWTDNPTFTVSYNDNGSTGGETPVDDNNYQANATVTVLANTGNLRRTAATFTGWNTEEDGSGDSYSAGATFEIGNTDVVLYAQWMIHVDVTVVYDGNGNTDGEAPVDLTVYEEGMQVTVRGNTVGLQLTGSTFTGWNTEADGSGNSYDGGDTFEMGDVNVTLYAQWDTNEYEVSFAANGGTGSPPPAASFDYGTVLSLPSQETLARTGYSFDGWNTTEEGNGTSYGAGDDYTVGASDVILYAKWEADAYEVSYSANGGSGSAPSSSSHDYGATISLPGQGTLERTGYTFAGWNTAAEGDGTSFDAGGDYTINAEDIILYADWDVNMYQVSYSANGGSGTAPSASTYNFGVTITMSGRGAMNRTGYTFTGWNTTAAGDGTSYSAGDDYTVESADITFYAEWAINQYEVSYNANGGAGSPPGKKTADYQEKITLPGQGGLTQSGYIFSGWNTRADGTGTMHQAGGVYTVGTSDVVFYAQWERIRYVVSFNTQGGSSVAVQNVIEGEYADEPSEPTYTGCTFEGWFKEASGVNAWSFTSEPVTEPVTLYAKWNATDQDGNVYTTVRIGNQTWMVQNLKTTKYSNGNNIPNVTDNTAWRDLTTPAYSWYDNDENTFKEYGALYNWYAMNTGLLAPEGWHVPTEQEWAEFATHLGGYGVAGGAIKETGTTHWNAPNEGATNQSGFFALGSGYRYYGNFTGIGMYSDMWSSTWSNTTHEETHGLYVHLHFESESLGRTGNYKHVGASVRLIHD